MSGRVFTLNGEKKRKLDLQPDDIFISVQFKRRFIKI